MEVKASARNIHRSSRKVRLVMDAVRGKRADEAMAILRFMPHAASREIFNVVKSAVANAENNYGLNPADLVVITATADQGPSFPMRFRAKARGQAGPFKKRTTHLTVVVDDEPVVAGAAKATAGVRGR